MLYAPRVVLLAAGLVAACGGGDDAPPVYDGRPPADARADAEQPDARTDGLGTIGTIPGSCANGTLTGTECQLLEVECPGVDSVQLELRITDPPGATPLRGTVLIGTPGAGTSYAEAVARDLLVDLLADGFRVVQRQWIGAGGWLSGPGGVEALACRYATLAEYVFDTIHASTTLPMCAAGSGEGASEIAYALARYDRGGDLDFALAIDGPTATRLDRGCLDGEDAAWLTECSTVIADNTTCKVQACGYDGAAAGLVDDAWGDDRCSTADDSTRAALLADSAGDDGNVFAYPNTGVQLLFGADDCTGAVVQGLVFAGQITTTSGVTFVPGVGHGVITTEAGQTAVRDSLLAGCAL
jgi:hypothetical protein